MILYGDSLHDMYIEIYGSTCGDCAIKDCEKYHPDRFNRICNDFEYDTNDENLKKNFRVEINISEYRKFHKEFCKKPENKDLRYTNTALEEFIKSKYDIPNFIYG